MNLFAERFLPLIEKSGKSDQELEKAMGLPRSIIYDWKNGRNKSSFKKYAGNFARYFNVSADYLLGNTDNSQSHTSEETDAQSTLISLIGRLTTEEQELITAQIRGILASRSAEPTQKIWLAASSADDQAPAIIDASKAKIKAAQDDHSLQNEEDI